MKTKLTTSLKTISKAIVVAGVVGAISLPVAAKKYRDYNQRSNSAVDYAKVVDVAPVIETYQVNEPVEQCWDERVPRRTSRHNSRYDNGYKRGHNSHTGEIFGAIIGAAVGNKVGSGRGKKVATAAGAILGGSIARDIKHSNKHRNRDRRNSSRYDNHRGYDVVQRCELKDSYVNKQQVVGYDVSYKYRGNIFHTQMGQHPGEKIKVKVTVNPV